MKKTKFAIGCFVQWYEILIIKEYISSIRSSIANYDKNEVIIDFGIFIGQQLEQFDGKEEDFTKLVSEFQSLITQLKSSGYNVYYTLYTDLYSIAEYRRDFNTKYCEKADVLVWGESDMLAPKQMFIILDMLHQQVDASSPKYLAFFSGCKMWDESWKLLEHPDFTDKPFLENDTTNWWSLRYTMSEKEMDEINAKTENPEVIILPQHKFNGCGLVISSEVIKAGANIPKGVFMAHEDTAFMYVTQKLLGNIPQFVIRNILLVHNRKHIHKRYKIKGESHIQPGDVNAGRKTHDWFNKQLQYNTENLHNLFNPNYKFKTWEDVWK